MALTITPLNPFVGAEIESVDLSKPLGAAQWEAIQEAYLEHSILLFRGQNLSKAEHVAFSRKFGELELHTVSVNTDPQYPEIFVIGNVHEADGGPPFLGRINEAWHSDSTFLEIPSAASLLYCRIAPRQGAETLFASARTAYETLPGELRSLIQGREARYSFVSLYEELLDQQMEGVEPLSTEEKRRHPDVWHPVVRQHPHNGTRSIYICEGSASEISGLDGDESDAIKAALCAHITRPEAVYRHHWRSGDLVLWDNRCTMHAATEFDPETEQRLMHRTTVIGDVPIAAAPEE